MSDPQFNLPPALAVEAEPFDLDDLDMALDQLNTRAAMQAEYQAGDRGIGALLTEAPKPDPRVTGFEIHDLGLAEWAMRHVAEINANEVALEAQRVEWQQRIDAWHAAMTKRLAARRAFLDHHLCEYAAEHRALDPKRNKTLHLPSGQVSSTESKPSIMVGDADRVVGWVEATFVPAERGDLVKITKAPIVAGLKALAHIGERQHVELGCSHRLEGELGLAIGDVVDCALCDVSVPVVDMIAEYPAVMDAAGHVIPGANIDPGGVTFKVKPAR